MEAEGQQLPLTNKETQSAVRLAGMCVGYTQEGSPKGGHSHTRSSGAEEGVGSAGLLGSTGFSRKTV